MTNYQTPEMLALNVLEIKDDDLYKQIIPDIEGGGEVMTIKVDGVTIKITVDSVGINVVDIQGAVICNLPDTTPLTLNEINYSKLGITINNKLVPLLNNYQRRAERPQMKIRMTNDQRRKIRNLANRRGTTSQAIVSAAIDEYINNA